MRSSAARFVGFGFFLGFVLFLIPEIFDGLVGMYVFLVVGAIAAPVLFYFFFRVIIDFYKNGS
jgi:hypothetical protein